VIVAKAEEADALVDAAVERPATVTDAGPTVEAQIPYRIVPSGLALLRPSSDGDMLIALTNFHARIMTDIAADDGVEISHTLDVEAKLGDRTRRFLVPAAQFHSMTWPLEHLGAEAVVYAGMGTRDHARAAFHLDVGLHVARRKLHQLRQVRCLAPQQQVVIEERSEWLLPACVVGLHVRRTA
jgi:hypothetical protein